MTNIRRPKRANNPSPLPLFGWAVSSENPRNLSLPARMIRHRFGCPLHRALLIAELAGFPSKGGDR